MFTNASNLNREVDMALWIITGISLFFLISLTSIIIFFVIRYRKEKHPKAIQIKENTMLEIAWTVIPLIIVLFMFWVGFRGFILMRKMPKDGLEISVVARKWDWTFIYPNGKESNELFVPIDKAVKLNMKSIDVIHSLYIPAFRVKEDVVPGYETYLWFIANEEDNYDIYCAEYCGLNHAFMGSKVRVLQQDSFARWLAVLPPKPDSALMEGLLVIKNNGCTGCHSLDGAKLIGPTFKNMYGMQETVTTDGKERLVTVDEAHIRTAIYETNKDIAQGYLKGIMQSYENKLTEEDIKKITFYLKSISDKNTK